MTPPPIVIAHRGASGYLPEHTLAAKALAHGLGADLSRARCRRHARLRSSSSCTISTWTTSATSRGDFPGDTAMTGATTSSTSISPSCETLHDLRAPRTRQRCRQVSRRDFQPTRACSASRRSRTSCVSIQGLNKLDGPHGGHLPGDQGSGVAPPARHRSRTAAVGRAARLRLFARATDPAFVQCFDAAELERLKTELGSRPEAHPARRRRTATTPSC